MLVIAWWEVFTLAVLADLMTLALMRSNIVVCEHGLASMVIVIVIVIVIMRSRCLSGLQGLGVIVIRYYDLLPSLPIQDFVTNLVKKRS